MATTYHARYLAAGMRADGLLPSSFGDVVDRRQRVHAASERRVSAELLAELRAQSAELPPSRAREAHLDALDGAAAVVATGQQVGLFLGPLYTIYKAASTVALARALTIESGIHCVPLFWLQTEDHDFEEIARCRMTAGPEVVDLGPLVADPAADRSSLGCRILGPEIDVALNALGDLLSARPYGAEVMALLRAHYRVGAPIAHAFAGVLSALFAEEGLVVFDPRRPLPSRLAASVLSRSLIDWKPIDQALAERGAELRAAGLDEQIRLRPHSPLVFFHPLGSRGARHRLVASDDEFRCSEAGAFTLPALLAKLEADPLSFSTSALLRPIVQDSLFPTAAYVGGPAEVSYFAQLAPLYPLFGLEAPLIAPRARFRLIPPSVRALCDELHLRPPDVDLPQDALLAKLPSVADSEPHGWTAELEARLDAEKNAPGVDAGLLRAIERTRFSVSRAVERLLRRRRRMILERQHTVFDRLTRLQRWLRPDGAPQERVYGFAGFAADQGLAAFIATIVAAVDPFDPTLKDLET